MSDIPQLLQSLHPMREPPLPSPVAPYLAAMAIRASAAIGLALFHAAVRRRFASRRSALAAFGAARHLDRDDRLAAQARLLRDIVRERHGDAEARLQGAAWLAALDRSFATDFFTRGQGMIFGTALYRRGTQDSVEMLDAALHRLIGRPALWLRRRRASPGAERA